ncbi:hypothetical protein [Yoonia maritima]|uniref:hypothetical protein n=1 Tax=Yoonia maritima TaxID=1435347 RepID=UPI000D0EEF72|nr:hypothetical protein [Yoonia maritima]
MRKQYHLRIIGSDTYIWDVHKLVEASVVLPIQDFPLTDIAEVNENWWYQESGSVPTPKSIAQHIRLVQQADLAYPIILCAKGWLMDGMHRVVKALSENHETIRAVQFQETPPYDFRNVLLDDLPYPDAPPKLS